MTQGVHDLFRRILGYLNFSQGSPDPQFRSAINDFYRDHRTSSPDISGLFGKTSEEHLADLSASNTAFSNAAQARQVLDLTINHVFPGYQHYHRDLLFHLKPEDFDQPYLLAVMFEATLRHPSLWSNPQELTRTAIDELNDYIGYRPLAVLENQTQHQPYAHEKFRPIPLYFAGSGMAHGPYEKLIGNTLAFFGRAPADIIQRAHFDLNELHELALDCRAYDHAHPVYRRTNYLFGEWDPSQVGGDHYYHRFIVRKIVVDALLDWLNSQKGIVDEEEAYFDASAALCGTILMASAISGSGPSTHHSTISLTNLLPMVARQRDEFYHRLLETTDGARKDRLLKHLESTRQPFGHVRQHLNRVLSRYGAQQLMSRSLAVLYARAGYTEASREQAAEIPALSIRFETEVRCRIRQVHYKLDHPDGSTSDGNNAQANTVTELVTEIEDLINRGIQCGAFVDPWNILGFQGHFPLFSSRDDSIPDPRVEVLMDVIEQIFQMLHRVVSVCILNDQKEAADHASATLRRMSESWDKYATTVIEDLPPLIGSEFYNSSQSVARMMKHWQEEGAKPADLAFWRQELEHLDNTTSLAEAISALIERKDHVASMGLLMEWAGKATELGLDASATSLTELLWRWVKLVVSTTMQQKDSAAGFQQIKRLFDFLEANAGEFFLVPKLDQVTQKPKTGNDQRDELDHLYDWDKPDTGGNWPGEESTNDEEDVFAAAYDDITYSDTTDDGQDSSLDEGGHAPVATEFERLQRTLQPRLRFLQTLARLWRFTGEYFNDKQASEKNGAVKKQIHEEGLFAEPKIKEVVLHWCEEIVRMREDLLDLLNDVWQLNIEENIGGHDDNIEFDIQHQVKYHMLHSVIATHVLLHEAFWTLSVCLPAEVAPPDELMIKGALRPLYEALTNHNTHGVQRHLPTVLDRLKRMPLLYIPFEYEGEPKQVLAAQTCQSIMTTLVSRLPELGLHRETWHVLNSAYRMERRMRPQGPSITEFDRLFRLALSTSLVNLQKSAQYWHRGHFGDHELVNLVGTIVKHYEEIWMKHSRSMRLSSVEILNDETTWNEVVSFIKNYGHDFFHARMLMLGNVRGILQLGVEKYLQYYLENQDNYQQSKLADDLENGRIDMAHAASVLETIYNCVIDKFDRFLEYNSTTTESDYGEKFYCLLEFLKVEADYERDEWNLFPLKLAHEVLVAHGRDEAAQAWQQVLTLRTVRQADEHLNRLKALEIQYGLRLPSLSDHLHERFVKPLAVSRMKTHLRQAYDAARTGDPNKSAFEKLQHEIQAYAETLLGSGIQAPEWVRYLEQEIDRLENHHGPSQDKDNEPLLTFHEKTSVREIRRQLKIWTDPISDSPKPQPRPKPTDEAP